MEKRKSLSAVFVSETRDTPSAVSNFLKKIDVLETVFDCSPAAEAANDKEANLLVVFGGEKLREFVRSVRLGMKEPLAPLVWFSHQKSEVISATADFAVFLNGEYPDGDAILEDARKILKILDTFQPIDEYQTPFESDKVKILRYMVSRGKDVLNPLSSENFRFGYDYPSVRSIVRFEPFELLSKMVIDEVLEQEFYDVVNLCPECDSSHLNFKKICPECKSSDLRIEDYIHHFRCGYLAPETDFRKENPDKLICPKCGRELKHIGVDYDKPSKVFICNKCGKIFEDPEKVFSCFNCGEVSAVEEVKKMTVKKFFITRYGRDVAFSGSMSNVYMRSILERDSRILPFSVFKMMLDIEKKRSYRYGTESCLLDLDLSSERIPASMLYEMIKDATNLLKLNLRETDIITVANGHILVLLFGTSCKRVSPLVERIKKKLGIFTVIKNKSAEVKFTLAEVK